MLVEEAIDVGENLLLHAPAHEEIEVAVVIAVPFARAEESKLATVRSDRFERPARGVWWALRITIAREREHRSGRRRERNRSERHSRAR